MQFIFYSGTTKLYHHWQEAMSSL